MEHKRRWSYGPGMFVTASEDGKMPGQDIKDDTRQHFFVGANRGSRWFMKTPGPSKFFKGVISKINVYDYAMSAFEVRGELGMTAAFKPTPEEGAENFSDDVDLAWKPGKGNAASFRVWIGDDQKAVEAGTAKSYDTQEPKLFVKGTLSGAKQYWRVAQLDKDGKLLDKGPIWSFQNTYGRAHGPRPVVGELVNPLHVLHWEGPIQAVKEQRVLFAESPEELDAKAEKGEYLYKGLTSQKGNNPRSHTIWVNASMDVLIRRRSSREGPAVELQGARLLHSRDRHGLDQALIRPRPPQRGRLQAIRGACRVPGTFVGKLSGAGDD
jgi:hypothetical protein